MENILFNKAIFDEYKLEYPYQTVLDGKWTFDAFAALAKQAAKDLNGDTKIDVENDQMGYITGHWIGPIQVLYTADQRICRKNEKDEMYMTLNTEKTVSEGTASVICPITPTVLMALRYIVNADIKRIFSFSVGEDDMPVFESACEKYLLHHLERSFDALEFYKSVKEG